MSSGQVAVVTGAARGIGAAVVRRLVDDGWSVVAVDRARDDPAVAYPLAGEEDLRSLAEHDDSVVPVSGDVRDPDVLHSAVRLAQEEFGRLDAAVAAAAVMAGGEPAWEISDERWDTLFDVDVRGVLNLARATVPRMLAAEPRDGRFVALASAAAHRGLWGLGAYCAAKHAVLGLVRGMARDLAGTGIRAVAVSPGSTRTDMLRATADLYGLDSVEDMAAHQLSRRLLEPDEVAAVVAFACSQQAAAVNGTVLHADGGFDG